jgi:hypothetical protein
MKIPPVVIVTTTQHNSNNQHHGDADSYAGATPMPPI